MGFDGSWRISWGGGVLVDGGFVAGFLAVFGVLAVGVFVSVFVMRVVVDLVIRFSGKRKRG